MQIQTKTVTYLHKKINGVITISSIPEFKSQPKKEQENAPFKEVCHGVSEYLGPEHKEKTTVSTKENNIALYLVSQVSKYFTTDKKD